MEAFLIAYMAPIMFAALVVFLLLGYPVAFSLGAVGLIFAYLGMGKLIYDAILGNDYNLALVALLLATLVTLVANLVADLAYGWLDPRIDYGG